jgi:hypothetical protein
MKKLLFIVISLIIFTLQAEAQRFITKSGTITFFSDGPLEKIEAINNKVNSALDTQSGVLVFKVLMKSFVFEKALMQEHFNENYVESDQYPLSVFKGKITNLSEIDFNKAGSYTAIVEGELTIHGKTNPVKTKGVFTVYDGGIKGKSSFTILLADYNIEIPGIVAGKIAEEILISVDINLKPLKK